MKTYERPRMTVLSFLATDIITMSGGGNVFGPSTFDFNENGKWE